MSSTKRYAAYVHRVAEQQEHHLERLRRFRGLSGTVSHMSDAKWQKLFELLSDVAGIRRIEVKSVFKEEVFALGLQRGWIEKQYMEAHHAFVIYREIEFVRISVDNPQSVLEALASVSKFKTELQDDSLMIYGYTRAAGPRNGRDALSEAPASAVQMQFKGFAPQSPTRRPLSSKIL